MNIHQGSRASSASSYLKPVVQRENLRVETNARVTRILFEENRAIGVEYQKDNKTFRVKATKEVLLCAGKFNWFLGKFWKCYESVHACRHLTVWFWNSCKFVFLWEQITCDQLVLTCTRWPNSEHLALTWYEFKCDNQNQYKACKLAQAESLCWLGVLTCKSIWPELQGTLVHLFWFVFLFVSFFLLFLRFNACVHQVSPSWLLLLLLLLLSGAIGSPQLLMLSGIGNAEDLKKLGIPVVANLPGVGRNLQNHLQVCVHQVSPSWLLLLLLLLLLLSGLKIYLKNPLPKALAIYHICWPSE